ncbi:MAG: hypothetical protein R3D05_11860 [Dongiaceae bacterium]
MSIASQSSEAQSYARFVILPDRRNSIESGIFGTALLLIGAYLGLGLISILFAALGTICVAYAFLSSRGRNSRPRLEIDNSGLREFSIFGRKYIEWNTVGWLEPRQRVLADGTDHMIRVRFSSPNNADTDPQPLPHYDLVLDSYLPKHADNLLAVTWIADWLEEFRQQAVSGRNALQHLRPPKYLKGSFA